MKKKRVSIKWLDSKGITSEWEFMDEIIPMPPDVCESIGFLIDDKKKYKTITQTITNGQILGRLTIPTCSIIKIKRLKF